MLLNAEGITRRFGHRIILNNVDISIFAGQVVSVFGANGVGKTTLIKILSTLLPPTSGEIWINGLEVKKHRDTVRRLVGVVVHEPLAYLDLSPYENLKFWASFMMLGIWRSEFLISCWMLVLINLRGSQ